MFGTYASAISGMHWPLTKKLPKSKPVNVDVEQAVHELISPAIVQ